MSESSGERGATQFDFRTARYDAPQPRADGLADLVQVVAVLPHGALEFLGRLR